MKSKFDIYNNAMFPELDINQIWLENCKKYLQTIFGKTLAGKSVIDYGFGRGNWSLAFLELGAASVLAIDASELAVARFKRYLDHSSITDIKPIVRNIDNEDLSAQADIVFLYGILHHVQFPEKLIKNASQWLKDSNSELLVYAYDADSFREILIRFSRQLLSGNQKLSDIEASLHPIARQRFNDDMLAPHVTFWNYNRLETLVSDHGLTITNQYTDFSTFIGSENVGEFNPHVIKCSPNSELKSYSMKKAHQERFYDVHTLFTYYFEDIASRIPLSERKLFVVGLFNTWFAYVDSNDLGIKLFYVWRYCVYIANKFSLKFENAVNANACNQMLDLTSSKTCSDETRVYLESIFPTFTDLIFCTNYRI